MRLEDRTGAGDFTSLAQTILRSGGQLREARELVDLDPRVPERVARIVKAGVAAGHTTDAGWGAALADAEAVSRAFLEQLAGVSVFDRLLSGGMRTVPLQTRAAASTSILTGTGVAEGAPIPVSSLALADIALAPRHAVALITMTSELAEAGDREAMRFLADELRKGVVAATDGMFLSGIIDSSSPPVSPVGTTDDAAVRTDIRKLLGAVYSHSGARLFWVAGRGVAVALSMLDTGFREFGPLGGDFLLVPAFISDEIATDSLMLIDATAFAASAGTVALSGAQHADVELNDTPTSGAATRTSLWQTNSRALKATRRFGFERLSADGAAIMSAIPWAQAVPA